jgi:cellulose synthase/poly-beta-1,6-N-acetylglucosamine synthase-like glycosyltransferase
MKISVIIGFYKRLDFLSLVLQGLSKQTFKGFEVLIAEDNNDPNTIRFVNEFQKTVSFPIKVVQQEDVGFRKNRILNEAIKQSTGEVIVFFDGDCIPHHECLSQHYLNTKDNTVLAGRRVMVAKSLSKKVVADNSLKRLSLFNIIAAGSTYVEEGIYLPYAWVPRKKKALMGCNFSLKREGLLAVNGFDEDYIKASVGEDADIEWRLLRSGYTIDSLKFKAIQYHIHHDSNYIEDDIQHNLKLMYKKMEENKPYCTNGLNKIN